MKKWILATSLIFISVTSMAKDCTVAQPKKLLNLTYPAKSALRKPVDVQFNLDGNMLWADFEVRTPTINAKKELGTNEYPYQGDVVEIFMAVNGDSKNLPYFEFELSPYNNTLTVRIDAVNKPYTYNLNLGLETSVQMTGTGWKGRLGIPLKNLGWNGKPESVIGNAYAILGKKGERSFFALTLPSQPKPNFHKPEFFRPLLSCR